MKPSDQSNVVAMPREAGIIGDDCYLTEMTDRLQRLRSLMGEQERRKGTKKRWLGKRRHSGVM